MIATHQLDNVFNILRKDPNRNCKIFAVQTIRKYFKETRMNHNKSLWITKII